MKDFRTTLRHSTSLTNFSISPMMSNDPGNLLILSIFPVTHSQRSRAIIDRQIFEILAHCHQLLTHKILHLTRDTSLRIVTDFLCPHLQRQALMHRIRGFHSGDNTYLAHKISLQTLIQIIHRPFHQTCQHNNLSIIEQPSHCPVLRPLTQNTYLWHSSLWACMLRDPCYPTG